MNRSEVILDLTEEIETLTRLHIQHGLQKTEGCQKQKDSIETYIVEPGLGTKSGATGALLLAQEAYAG